MDRKTNILRLESEKRILIRITCEIIPVWLNIFTIKIRKIPYKTVFLPTLEYDKLIWDHSHSVDGGHIIAEENWVGKIQLAFGSGIISRDFVKIETSLRRAKNLRGRLRPGTAPSESTKRIAWRSTSETMSNPTIRIGKGSCQSTVAKDHWFDSVCRRTVKRKAYKHGR